MYTTGTKAMCYVKSESAGRKTETPRNVQKWQSTEIESNTFRCGSQSQVHIAIVDLVSTKQHHLSQ